MYDLYQVNTRVHYPLQISIYTGSKWLHKAKAIRTKIPIVHNITLEKPDISDKWIELHIGLSQTQSLEEINLNFLNSLQKIYVV